jgi:hypothetical protein
MATSRGELRQGMPRGRKKGRRTICHSPCLAQSWLTLLLRKLLRRECHRPQREREREREKHYGNSGFCDFRGPSTAVPTHMSCEEVSRLAVRRALLLLCTFSHKVGQLHRVSKTLRHPFRRMSSLIVALETIFLVAGHRFRSSIKQFTEFTLLARLRGTEFR